MNRTITVKGRGHAVTAPDCIRLSFSLSTLRKKYADMLREASDKLNALYTVCAAEGIEQNEIKTLSFRTDTQYRYVKSEDGNSRSVFDGYTCHQRLSLLLPIDNNLLNRLLSAIAKADSDPNINIDFTVRDPEPFRTALLESAARDARTKAGILCAASGVRLGELTAIDYSWGEIDLRANFEYSCMPMACKSESFHAPMTPEDITFDDTVTFVWEII